MPHASLLELLCPWPGCGFQIWFIDFRLELTDRTLHDQGVAAWESGAGLVGRCPGCGTRSYSVCTASFVLNRTTTPQERCDSRTIGLSAPYFWTRMAMSSAFKL